MKKNLNLRNIIIVIIILILILIGIIILINNIKTTNVGEEQANEIVVENNNVINTEIEEDIIAELQGMNERDRIQYYFSEFIGYIEEGDYLKAYELLYPEFRETYFKTLDEFKTYVDKTYPEFVSFSYNNIERQGSIYVLMITVINPDLNKEEAKKSQRIVIQENDFNDFVLSFQVI